jgi:hypothetical protein
MYFTSVRILKKGTRDLQRLLRSRILTALAINKVGKRQGFTGGCMLYKTIDYNMCCLVKSATSIRTTDVAGEIILHNTTTINGCRSNDNLGNSR